MGMRINTNLDALNAQRNLATTGLSYSKSVEKLSSGLRINSAADDAAGLTISEKLRSQTMGLAQSSRNAQDGISMIQTGEGALNETASILQRMRELTVQGGNDTLQTADRGAIKSELDQLSSEINRISSTTQFNGTTLLNGSLSAKGTIGTLNSSGASGLTGLTTTALLTAATSAPSAATSATITGSSALATIGTGGTLTINGMNVVLTAGHTAGQTVNDINNTMGLGSGGAVTASLNTAGDLVLTSNTPGATGTVTVGAASGAGNTIYANLGLSAGLNTARGLDKPSALASAGNYTVSITQAATAVNVSGKTVAVAAANAGTLTLNGVNIAIAAAETVATTVANINLQTANTGVVAKVAVAADVTAGNATAAGDVLLTSVAKGSTSGIVIGANSAGSATTLSDLGLSSASGIFTADNAMTVAGKDAAGTYTAPGTTNTVAFSATNGTTLYGGGLAVDTTLLATGTAAVAANNSYTFSVTSKAATLQIGANSGQTLSVGLEDMSATTLGVGNLDVSSSANINAVNTGTLALIDKAIASVSAQRASLGAYQNRLEHTISNLGVSQANLTASESRIRDVDMAAEMVNFTKTGILQQAGQAILAQANQSGSGVMSLLR